MNIKTKILAGFAVVLMIFTVAASIIYMKLNTTKAEVSKIEHQTTRFGELSEVQYNMAMQAADIRGFLFYKQDSFVASLGEAADKNIEIIQQMINTATQASDKESYEKLKQVQDQYANLLMNRLVPLVREGKAEEASQLARNEGVPLNREFIKLIGELKKDRMNRVAEANTNAIQNMNEVISTTLLAAVLAIVLGLAIGIYLARFISAPIQRVVKTAEKIADGDLSGEALDVKSKDEIGQLSKMFNTMQENLREIVQVLQEKAELVAASSMQLSASAQNVAAGSSETAAAVTQVAGNAEQVNINTNQIATAASESGQYAREGNHGIEKIYSQMEAIIKSTETSGQVTQGLHQSAEKIGQIVELITHIADQTNLLALNAAIEAARAGEQGRGFAVVADEVRKLAEKSGDAAKEIYTLITDIQKESQAAVKTMEQGSLQVQEGARTVEDVGTVFQKIISSVEGLNVDIQQLSVASEEISSAVQNVAAAVEEQTATMEEVSSTTQSLNAMADELEVLAQRFKL